MGDPQQTQPDPTRRDQPDPAEPRGVLYISGIQALQRADTVSFHTDGDTAHIDASLTSFPFDEPRIYTAKEQRLFPDADRLDRRRRIDVDAAIAGFDAQRRWHEHDLPGAAACTTIQAARLDEVWCSIAGLLRVGDVLRLHWRAGNITDALTGAGLYRDELRIGVQRGRRHWVFLLEVAIRPSTARMITLTLA